MTTDFYVFVSDNPFTSTDLSTTLALAQPGVSNYYHSGFAGPTSTTAATSVNVNRTGRYVRVQLAGTQYLVLGEVQVWSQPAKLEWMVTDQLGTPRMIVDQTGSTAAVSRHDYLPFGEELFSGVGGRTTVLGYGNADGARQQFTQKERDNETGLDYFGARYYASSQGRFTGVDPENASAAPSDPQSWNGYAYARNNPLTIVDPDGREFQWTNANGEIYYLTDAQFFQAKKDLQAQGYIFENGKFYVDQADGNGGTTRVAAGSYMRTDTSSMWDEVAPQLSRRLEPVLKVAKVEAQIIFLFSLPPGGGGPVTSLGLGATERAAASGSAIKIGAQALTHVLERHATTGARTGGKSIFNAGEDVVGLIKQAENVPAVRQAGRQTFERVVNAGRTFGVDRATGQPTSVYTVITDAAGNLKTAFPGKP